MCVQQSQDTNCYLFAHLHRVTSVRDVDAETQTNLELRQGNHITQNMASPQFFFGSVYIHLSYESLLSGKANLACFSVCS